MLYRSLLSLGASVFLASIAQAQPSRTPPTSLDGSRAAVPSGIKAPTNKLDERALTRGLINSSDSRLYAPPATEERVFPGNYPNDRSYNAPNDLSARTLIAPSESRDLSLFRASPEDRPNKLPEAALSRHLAPEDNSRQALPRGHLAPADRRSFGDR